MSEEYRCRADQVGWQVERVYRPVRFWPRSLGLLARAPLRTGEGLWLDPCGGIHTWAMGYTLDVVFLDPELKVLAIRSHVRPWRLVFAPKGTRSVLELPAGAARSLRSGTRLQMTATR